MRSVPNLPVTALDRSKPLGSLDRGKDSEPAPKVGDECGVAVERGALFSLEDGREQSAKMDKPTRTATDIKNGFRKQKLGFIRPPGKAVMSFNVSLCRFDGFAPVELCVLDILQGGCA
jgi:hypothetical protein